MFKHILVPTDGTPLSESAARNAVQFAKSTSARVTAITVSIPFHVFTTDAVMVTDTESIYQEDCNKRAAKYLDAIGKVAKAAGVTFEGMHVFHEQPHVAIIDAAGKKGCDVICMASHGRKGLSALVLGSETFKVLTHSKIPVLVWR
jgi:nucleotide-binding universal stress UspA family protein